MHRTALYLNRALFIFLLLLTLTISKSYQSSAQEGETAEATEQPPAPPADEPPPIPTEAIIEEPTSVPTEETSPEVTESPTPEATEAPTEEVTPEATEAPTEETTPEATEAPTEETTPEATAEPTQPASLQILESDNPAVAQLGLWTGIEDASASGGSYLASSGSTGDILSLAFEGSTLEIAYVQGPDFGAFAIEIDGAVVQPVAAQADANALTQIAIDSVGEGTHTLRIVPLNGVVGIDTFAAVGFAALPEVTPEATPEATETVDLPLSMLEASLTTLYQDTFDERADNRWSLSDDWVFVPNQDGWALNIADSASPAVYNLESYLNIQAQARFLFETGAVQLSIRRSDAGAYIAELNADGTVTLSRGDVALGSAVVAANAEGEWRTLALSAIEGNVRVSVDGVEAVAVNDPEPLPAGLIAFGAVEANIPDLVVDDFTIYAPAANIPDMKSDEQAQSAAENAILTDLFAVQLSSGADAGDVADDLGFDNEGQVAQLDNFYVFRKDGADDNNAIARAANRALAIDERVVWFEQQLGIEYQTASVTDPLFKQQWHLKDNKSNGANVLNAWNLGYTGAGVQVAIVDDSYEYTHPDLDDQYVGADSQDYRDGVGGDDDPFPEFSDDNHGTSVAGLVGADNDNGTCGVGVAYDANMAGIQLIGGPIGDSDIAAALTHNNANNEIYNNSWGPTTVGQGLYSTGAIIQNALLDGATNGRGGLGSIFVFAAGNFRQYYDNVNTNGIASSRYTIAIGATDKNGKYAAYSQPGASMFIAAPGGSRSVVTTDRQGSNGYNGIGGKPECTNQFDGTSAASPVVSGAIALMLEANPNLGWRDIQHILALTAYKNDVKSTGWATNAAGYHINHDYGFGLLDTAAAVSLAEVWFTPLPTYQTFTQAVVNVNQAIPDANHTGITSTVNVNTLPANFVLEHVEVVFNATHTWRGDVHVQLIAPSGTSSVLMTTRFFDSGDNYTNTRMMSVRHWGESGNGTWTLRVSDRVIADTGTWQNWQLILYGHVDAATAPTSAPTLLTPSPLSGGYSNQINTMLTWAAVGGASHYQVQLDDAADFLTPLENVGNRTVTNFTTMALTNGKKYYWRVRARNNNHFGPWSASANFIFDNLPPVGETKLIRPANNSFTSDSTPAFSWGKLKDAVSFELRIDTEQACNSGDITGLTRNSYTPATPLNEDTYWWCVRQADKAQNWTPWSVAYQFQITLLRSPVNAPDTKSAITDSTPTFSWAKATGSGITYRLLVDDDVDVLNGPILDVPGLTTTRYTVPTGTPLTIGDTYYWRVIPSGGWTVTDPVVWSFLLTPTRLVAPKLTAPPTGAFINDTTPDLVWDTASVPNIPGVTLNFEIWLDDSSKFTSPYMVMDADGTHTVNPALPATPGTRYYWKVRAIYDGLTAGPWSRTGNFTLDTEALTEAPILSTPADLALAGNGQPTFKWGKVKGATRYELLLELGDNSPDVQVYFGAKNSYKPGTPLPGGIYFWQVIAYDAAGNPSPASAVRSVTIP